MNFISLVWRKQSVRIFLSFEAFFVLVYKYFSLENGLKSSLVGAFIAIAVLVLEKTLETYFNYQRFKNIEGKYFAYSYKQDEDPKKGDYDQLKDENNGEAILVYKGGKEFLICLNNVGNKYQWKGLIEFHDINTASCAWWYITPPSLRDCCGYKKLVVLENINPMRIYMFSDDNQRFGREVLIKKSCEKKYRFQHTSLIDSKFSGDGKIGTGKQSRTNAQ
jgi:hypothetical protein